MPDTGAPWNIPYVTSSDLVKDWPADSLALANAIDSGLGLAGGLIQVQQTVKTDTFSTTSSSFVDVTGLTVSITPSSASHRILLMASFSFQGTSGSSFGAQVRFNGGNANTFDDDAAGGIFRISTGGLDTAYVTPVYVDSPATTSAVTYAVQIRRLASATVYIGQSSSSNWANAPASLIAMEIRV